MSHYGTDQFQLRMPGRTSDFIEKAREICTRESIVLIFDEVICGMRMSPGSVQRYFNVIPDLKTTAKAIGGGLPIALIGGKVVDLLRC